MLRLLYRQLTLDPVRTGLTATAFETQDRCFLKVDEHNPLLGGFRQDSFITLRLVRYP